MWRSKMLIFCLILCLGVSSLGRLFVVSADEVVSSDDTDEVTIGGYNETDYKLAVTIANILVMGYALKIPANYIKVIPGGAAGNPSPQPKVDWAYFRSSQVNKIIEVYDKALASHRQKQYLSTIFQVHGLTQDPNLYDLHIPIGISDYWNTTGKDFSYSDGSASDGPGYITAADINLSSTPYFDSAYDWYITDYTGGDTYVLVNSYSFEDTEGDEHGMFYYLSNPNVLPASPSSVYASTFDSSLQPEGLYKRGGNSYSYFAMYSSIDLLLPPADSSFYQGGYTWLEVNNYGSPSLSGNSFSGSVRNGLDKSSNIEGPYVNLAREHDDTTYTSDGVLYYLGSNNQFTGPYYMIFVPDRGAPSFSSLNIPYNGDGLEGLIRDAQGMFCGNGLNIYVGNDWSDAQPLDSSSGSSVTPVETNGVKPYHLPGNTNNDSTWNLTELLDWLNGQLLNNPNGLTIDASDIPDAVITPENATDPVPLVEVVPAVVRDAMPENQPDPEGDTPDPDTNLPMSLPHATDGSKLWSLRLHSSGEDLDAEGTDSPVDVAINLFQMADASTGGIFVYVLSIVGVLLVVGVIIRLLHS